jgi:hypothetical protein
VGLRAGLNDAEKRKFLTLPGTEIRLFGRPARSQPLYRLLANSVNVDLKVAGNNSLERKLEPVSTPHFQSCLMYPFHVST